MLNKKKNSQVKEEINILTEHWFHIAAFSNKKFLVKCSHPT